MKAKAVSIDRTLGSFKSNNPKLIAEYTQDTIDRLKMELRQALADFEE